MCAEKEVATEHAAARITSRTFRSTLADLLFFPVAIVQVPRIVERMSVAHHSHPLFCTKLGTLPDTVIASAGIAVSALSVSSTPKQTNRDFARESAPSRSRFGSHLEHGHNGNRSHQPRNRRLPAEQPADVRKTKSIRFSDSQWKEVKTAAERHKIPVAEFVRQSILEIPRSRDSVRSGTPDRAYLPVHVHADDSQAIRTCPRRARRRVGEACRARLAIAGPAADSGFAPMHVERAAPKIPCRGMRPP